MRWFLSCLFLCLVAVVNALSSSGNRLLVVLEDATEKNLYSTFWSDLEARGYDIVFGSPKDDKLSLFRLGERAYDHLLILPPKSKGFGPSLSPKNILDFMNKEGNVLLALSGQSTTPSAISSLLIQLEIHLPTDRSAVVVDHFNYDTLSAPENHDVLVLDRPGPIRNDTKAYFSGDGVLAIPRATPQILGTGSPLVAPILRAPPTAYHYNPKEGTLSVEDVTATGSQLALVSAFQARNSARFTVLGSAEFLQDKWFSASVKKPGDGGKVKEGLGTVNQEFAQQVSSWTFKETGVLKAGRFEHHLVENNGTNPGDLNPTMYRVKNDVTFNIELSEYKTDHLTPYNPPENDEIQLEFTMLSPFHRLTLHPSSSKTDQPKNSTTFTTTFTIPDQHGIFSFRVNYKRPFLTNIDEKEEVTVRHFAHDEYARSWAIPGAWVWIAGLGAVVAGFLGFVFVWLYSEPTTVAGVVGGQQEKKRQ